MNTNQLAQGMRVSRTTVWRWCSAGYQFQFGDRTTLAHCQEWLKTVYAPMVRERKAALKRLRVKALQRMGK